MALNPGPLPLFNGRVEPETDDAPTIRFAVEPEAQATTGPLEPPPPPAGAGRIVRHGWPLLSLMARITGGLAASNAEQLKTSAIALVREFERTTLADGISPRDVSAARYVLCTALDEAVLTSAWGLSTDWNNGSLLSRFHNETWGGEKVFTLIDRAMQDPGQFGDLLELCHFVLLLGFQGKYRLARDGSSEADALRRRLYDILHPRFGAPPALVTPQPVVAARNGRAINYVPVWTVGAVCLLILALVYGWLDYTLTSEANTVARVINKLHSPAAAATGVSATK
ncbi:MAG: type IVB secretion system protein IcmH/DotU [Acetobacteraceae bacterium]